MPRIPPHCPTSSWVLVAVRQSRRQIKRVHPPGPGLAHQENITWHWNEVISSSRCEEMGIYVAAGMVFIFPNFQITFD